MVYHILSQIAQIIMVKTKFPEKLIPLFITNILNNKPLPVYIMATIPETGYMLLTTHLR